MWKNDKENERDFEGREMFRKVREREKKERRDYVNLL